MLAIVLGELPSCSHDDLTQNCQKRVYNAMNIFLVYSYVSRALEQCLVQSRCSINIIDLRGRYHWYHHVLGFPESQSHIGEMSPSSFPLCHHKLHASPTLTYNLIFFLLPSSSPRLIYKNFLFTYLIIKVSCFHLVNKPFGMSLVFLLLLLSTDTMGQL